MNRDNTGRVSAARFALASFQWANGEAISEDEHVVIDLLADLRHYCDVFGFCFVDLDRIAYAHYLVERSGADKGR